MSSDQSQGNEVRFSNVFLLGVQQSNLSFDGLPTLSTKKEYSITGNLIDLQNDNGVKNILEEGSEIFSKIIEAAQDIYINDLLIEDASIQSFSVTGEHIKTAEYNATISSSKESSLSLISLSQNKDSALAFSDNNQGIVDEDLKYLENLSENFSFSSDDRGEVTVNHSVGCRFRNRKALVSNKYIKDEFVDQGVSISNQKESFLKNKGKGALVVSSNTNPSINLSLNEISTRVDGSAGNYVLYFDYLGQKGASGLWQDITVTIGNLSEAENSQVSKVLREKTGRQYIEFSSRKVVSGGNLAQGETPLSIQGGAGLDAYFNNFKLVKKDDLSIEKSRALSSFLLNSSPNYGLLENQYKDTYGLSETFVNFQTNESFDEMTLEYSVQKTTTYGNLDDQNNYSTATNHSITIGEDGIFNITENCTVRALTTKTEIKLKEYVDEAILESFERCKSAFVDYSNAYNTECLLEEYDDITDDPITADTFFSTPINLTKSFDFFNGVANVVATFSNDPKLKSDHTHEYNQSVEKNAGVNSITISGVVRGIGDTINQKNIATINAYNGIKNNIASVLAETKSNAGISSVFYLDSSSVSTNKQDGSLSYSYGYSDKKSLEEEGGNIIKRFDISIVNDHPLKVFNSFSISCLPVIQVMGDLFSPLAMKISATGNAYRGVTESQILTKIKNILNDRGLLCGRGDYSSEAIKVFLNNESFSHDLNGNSFTYETECLDLSDAPTGWGTDDGEDITFTTSDATTTTQIDDWGNFTSTTLTTDDCTQLNCSSDCTQLCLELGCCTTTTGTINTTTLEPVNLEPNLVNSYSLKCGDIPSIENSEALSCKEGDARQLYDSDSAWTNQFQYDINRNYFTIKDIEFSGVNGIVVFEVKVLDESDPVKIELFYGNTKVATSSMNTSSNNGPFDENLILDSESVDQYISPSKGSIPNRLSDLQSAISGNVHECISSSIESTNGFHQFIWFEFDYFDYINKGSSNTIRLSITNIGSRNSVEIINRCDISKNYEDLGVMTTTTTPGVTATPTSTTSSIPQTTTPVPATTTTIDPTTIIPEGNFTRGYFKNFFVPSGTNLVSNIVGTKKIYKAIPCNETVYSNNDNIIKYLNFGLDYFSTKGVLSENERAVDCDVEPSSLFAINQIKDETISENAKNTLSVINCEENAETNSTTMRYHSIICEIDESDASFENCTLTNLQNSSESNTISDFRIADDSLPDIKKSIYIVLTIPQFFTGTAQDLYNSANTNLGIETELGTPDSVGLYGGLSQSKQMQYTAGKSMSTYLIRSDENNLSHPNYESGTYSSGCVFYGGSHEVNGVSIDLGGFVVYELKYSTDKTLTNDFKWMRYQMLNGSKAVSIWVKDESGNLYYDNVNFNPDYQYNPTPVMIDSISSRLFMMAGTEVQEFLNSANYESCIDNHEFSADSATNSSLKAEVKEHTSELFKLGSSSAHDYQVVKLDIQINSSNTLTDYYTAPAGKTATIVGVETCAGVKEFIVDCSADSPLQQYDAMFEEYEAIPYETALSSCNGYSNKINYDSSLNYNYYGADTVDPCSVANTTLDKLTAVYFKVE